VFRNDGNRFKQKQKQKKQNKINNKIKTNIKTKMIVKTSICFCKSCEVVAGEVVAGGVFERKFVEAFP